MCHAGITWLGSGNGKHWGLDHLSPEELSRLRGEGITAALARAGGDAASPQQHEPVTPPSQQVGGQGRGRGRGPGPGRGQGRGQQGATGLRTPGRGRGAGSDGVPGFLRFQLPTVFTPTAKRRRPGEVAGPKRPHNEPPIIKEQFKKMPLKGGRPAGGRQNCYIQQRFNPYIAQGVGGVENARLAYTLSVLARDYDGLDWSDIDLYDEQGWLDMVANAYAEADEHFAPIDAYVAELRAAAAAAEGGEGGGGNGDGDGDGGGNGDGDGDGVAGGSGDGGEGASGAGPDAGGQSFTRSDIPLSAVLARASTNEGAGSDLVNLVSSSDDDESVEQEQGQEQAGPFYRGGEANVKQEDGVRQQLDFYMDPYEGVLCMDADKE